MKSLMTNLEQMSAEQEAAPRWNLSARASREWRMDFYAGNVLGDSCRHVTSPSRALEIARQEFAQLKPQGCTRMVVILNGSVVHEEA